MFKLDRSRIHELAGNDTAYARGRTLHDGKALLRFHWAEDGLLLEADIRDQRTEHTRITLDAAGMPAARSCTCKESAGSGLCRHQVTLLLEARERQRARDAYPGHLAGSLQTGPLHLRTLLILPPNPAMPFAVELELGIGPLRPILDVSAFLSGWRMGIGMPADPTATEAGGLDRTRLGTSSQRLLDWLSGRNGAIRPQRAHAIFSDLRAVRLSSHELAVFLTLASATGTAEWTDVTRRQLLRIGQVETELPISFHLDAQLHLHLLTEEPLMMLDEEHGTFRMGNRFFVPQPETVRPVGPVLDAMNKARRQVLSLTMQEASHFVADQVSEIRRHYPVTFAPEAALLANPAPLETQVALDVSGRSLTAGIRFRYGDWETDPLCLTDAASLSPARDKTGESRMLARFRQAGFLPVDSFLALQGDEAQYNFLHDILPLLHSEAVVRESKAFRKQMAVQPAPITFTIGPGSAAGWMRGLLRIGEDSAHPLLTRAELPHLLASLRRGARYYRTHTGVFLILEEEGLSALGGLLDDPAIRENADRSDESGILFDIPSYRLPALAHLGEGAGTDRIRLDSTLQVLMDQLSHPGQSEQEPPGLSVFLENTLRDYQKTGWRWLSSLVHFGFGGILADDMGLGKTVQVIAVLGTLGKMPGLAGMPALIVAPSSLLLNWKAEFLKFAPELRVLVLDGPKTERVELMKQVSETNAVITSYPLIRRDIGDLRQLSFSACILDEAQHIKNPETANARSVKQIRASHRFAVTGTPMENTLTELWSVFDFLMPGCLHSHRQFQLRYELPIQKNGDTAILQSLARLVRPFILRRLKSDVLQELPEKIETLSLCGMTREQKRMYLAFLKKARKSFEDTSGKENAGQNRVRIFALLTRLRQICCDPELVEPGCGAGSGKLEQLLEVLDEALEAGHRILLFSQFTSMLDRIDAILEERKIPRLRLDGRTHMDKRLPLVNAFNAGEGKVFLISLKAGGTGLNLTGADTVIHYDPWWNPAAEDQATDRAHRIGQTQTVQVIRLVTRGTIEESILQLQERKRNLIGQIVKPGGTFLDALSMEEIRSLFDA